MNSTVSVNRAGSAHPFDAVVDTLEHQRAAPYRLFGDMRDEEVSFNHGFINGQYV